MSTIIYGGVKYKQIRNAVYCKHCKETIESKYIHDLKYCSCNAIGIDGGIYEGNRIIGNTSDIEYRSVYQAIINNKKYLIPYPSRIIEKIITYK